LTGGSSGGTSTGTTGTTSTKLNRAARKQLGDGTQGCVASPSRAMMSELSAQEPAPTLVKTEPAGMGGPQNTDALSRLVKKVATRQHMSKGQAFKRVAGPFPLAGAAAWSNDWHAYRPCPYPHLHEGLDMFANRGTPAVAAANGVLDEKGESSMSGLYVEVTDGHGTQYFYDHFEAFASKLHQGMRVHRGQVLGFVGNTGDASGGPTHLHFEVQPQGTPTPPKPWVDAWLLQAMQRARVLAGQSPSASIKNALRHQANQRRPEAAPAAGSTSPEVQARQPVALQPSSSGLVFGFSVLVAALAALAVIAGLIALGFEVRRRTRAGHYSSRKDAAPAAAGPITRA
jgi:murein DD-endopeptidase MepM/ murein hydrolase activator NlpD